MWNITLMLNYYYFLIYFKKALFELFNKIKYHLEHLTAYKRTVLFVQGVHNSMWIVLRGRRYIKKTTFWFIFKIKDIINQTFFYFLFGGQSCKVNVTLPGNKSWKKSDQFISLQKWFSRGNERWHILIYLQFSIICTRKHN